LGAVAWLMKSFDVLVRCLHAPETLQMHNVDRGASDENHSLSSHALGCLLRPMKPTPRTSQTLWVRPSNAASGTSQWPCWQHARSSVPGHVAPHALHHMLVLASSMTRLHGRLEGRVLTCASRFLRFFGLRMGMGRDVSNTARYVRTRSMNS
jgi:hypothetical protein